VTHLAGIGYFFTYWNSSKGHYVHLIFFVSSEELQEKYEGKLTKEMSGPTYEVMGKVMKAIVNRKITVPGGFVG
jgi:structure-specific recognition protein 1